MPVDLQYFATRNRELAPSTRFQGSKRKLLPWIESVFEDLDFCRAIDLMSGTSSVAYLLKRMGKEVVANDYLKFNYRTAQAFIENRRYRLSDQDIGWILGTHKNVEYGSFISDNFGGYYFTDDENRRIDHLICNINALEGQNRPSTQAKRALATHSLIQACLMKRPFNLFHRRNLSIRTAKVSRSFGNRTTWEKPLDFLLVKRIKESNRYVFDNGFSNEALNSDAARVADPTVDLVYLDPPYFPQKSDRRQSNYRFTYHFAEGLAQYDAWPEMVDSESNLRALKPNGNSGEVLYQCEKADLRDNLLKWLDRIVTNWPDAQIVMSYKHPSMPSTWAIKKLLEDTGRTVSVRRAAYKYALNRRNGKPKENLEILFVAN